MDNQLLNALIFNEFFGDYISRDINKRMTIFLKSITNRFDQDERNFLAAMLLGGLYEFEYSHKKIKIENHKYMLKTLYYYDRNNSILHLVFIINDKQRYLRSIMLLPDKKNKFKLPIELKNLPFTDSSMIKIIYKKNEGYIWESPKLPFRLKEIPEDNELITKLTHQRKFILINRISETELRPENINEKHTILFGQNNIAIVEEAVTSYLSYSQKVFYAALNDLIYMFGSDFVRAKLFKQGFLFGELALIHRLKARIEPSLNGSSVDIIVVYKSTSENRYPYPIFFKANDKDILFSEDIGQIQKFYLTTRMELPNASYNPQAIIVNYSLMESELFLASTLNIRSVSITPSNQIMSNFFLKTLSNKQCKENLKNLFYINFYEKNIRNYFLQLLGFAISFNGEGYTLTKGIFLWKDKKLYDHYGILAINHESASGIKTRLILDLRQKNFRNESDQQVKSTNESASIIDATIDSVINSLINRASEDQVLVRHVYVEIDTTKNNAEDFFAVVRINNNPNFYSNFSHVTIGIVKELYSLTFQQLFSYSIEDGKYNFYINNLSRVVNNIRPLIKEKIHFQCLFQGILAGLADKENLLIRFGKPNHFKGYQIDGILKIIKKVANNSLKEKKAFIFNIQYESGKIKEESSERLGYSVLDKLEKHAANLKISTKLSHIEAIILIINENEFLENKFLTNLDRLIKIEAIKKDESLINESKLCNDNKMDQNKCSIISSCSDFKQAFYELSGLSNDEWINIYAGEKKFVQNFIKKGVKKETIDLFKAYCNTLIGQLIESLIHQIGADDRVFGYHNLETKYRLKKYIFFLILHNSFDTNLDLFGNNFDITPISNNVFNAWALNVANYFIKYQIAKDAGKILQKLASNPFIKPPIIAVKFLTGGSDSFTNVLITGKFKSWLLRNSQKQVEYFYYQVISDKSTHIPFLLGKALISSILKFADVIDKLNHYTEVLNLSLETKFDIVWKTFLERDLSSYDFQRDTKLLMNVKLELVKNILLKTEGLKAVVWYSESPIIHKKYIVLEDKLSTNDVCTTEVTTKIRFNHFNVPINGHLVENVVTKTDLQYLNVSNYLPLFPHYFGDYEGRKQEIQSLRLVCGTSRNVYSGVCKNLPSLEKDHEDRKLVSIHTDFIDKNVMPLLKQADVGIFSWVDYPKGQPLDSLVLFRMDVELASDRFLDSSYNCSKGTILEDNRQFFYFKSTENNPISPFILALNKREADESIFYLSGGFNTVIHKNYDDAFYKKFNKGIYTLKATDKNPAIILVNEGGVYYLGSDEGTLFILVNQPQGIIKGGKNQDIVDLNNLNMDSYLFINRVIESDFPNNKISYFVQGRDGNHQLKIMDIYSIEIYRGHFNASETIYTDCKTAFVDGRGGGDLIVGSQVKCSSEQKELRVVNLGDIHYFDPYKTIIYDIQPNASVFLSHDKSKNLILTFPQIVILNEKFNNLNFKKIYFDKIFNSDGELFKFVPASMEYYDISYQGYIIYSDKKQLLIDSYGANILFITTDNFQFSVYEASLQDYFDDINNQVLYERYNKGNFALYKKVTEKPDTQGLKISLIKTINASMGISAINAACDEVDRHENLPSVDSFTILHGNEKEKITTYIFGSTRQSIFFADAVGDYYFKTIGLSNIFYIYPPIQLLEETSQSMFLNIYIEKELILISDKDEDNLLDLTEFKSFRRLTKPYLIKSNNNFKHLQFKYVTTNNYALLELNIYLKNSKLLKIKFDDCDYEFDASKTDPFVNKIHKPYFSALQHSPESSESSWWPSVMYGFSGFLVGSIATCLMTNSCFFSPYRLISQVNTDTREAALALSIGLNQIGGVAQDFVKNAIYPVIDIKPAKVIHTKQTYERGHGTIQQIESHTSTELIHTTDLTFKVDQPTFNLIRVMFFHRDFNKRINKVNKIQNAVAVNDSYSDSFIREHENHMGRMYKLGIN